MFTENLPFVAPETKLAEAIEIVTNGKLGVGIVVEQEPTANANANAALVGIITDGDIRRAMLRLGQAFFTTPVADIMSHNPKTINKDAKIVEAGETMNHYSIHTLIVVEEKSQIINDKSQMSNTHVVGVVDSFSCLPGTRFYH